MLAEPQASDYLRRFHCDLAMHDPKLTRMLIDLVGADRVVRGTDFPRGMAITNPVEYVEATPNITEKERQLILFENPARLLML
jgi:predicted TIM-barrel fold metal-dependent hydrolase